MSPCVLMGSGSRVEGAEPWQRMDAPRGCHDCPGRALPSDIPHSSRPSRPLSLETVRLSVSRFICFFRSNFCLLDTMHAIFIKLVRATLVKNCVGFKSVGLERIVCGSHRVLASPSQSSFCHRVFEPSHPHLSSPLHFPVTAVLFSVSMRLHQSF